MNGKALFVTEEAVELDLPNSKIRPSARSLFTLELDE